MANELKPEQINDLIDTKYLKKSFLPVQEVLPHCRANSSCNRNNFTMRAQDSYGGWMQ